MKVNNMKSRIKKGDLVKIIAGSQKGKTAKVERVDSSSSLVFLEKISIIKRHVKRSQANPRGGSKEIHRGLPISNVAFLTNESKGETSRIGYEVKDGKKVRIAKKTRKEIA